MLCLPNLQRAYHTYVQNRYSSVDETTLYLTLSCTINRTKTTEAVLMPGIRLLQTDADHTGSKKKMLSTNRESNYSSTLLVMEQGDCGVRGLLRLETHRGGSEQRCCRGHKFGCQESERAPPSPYYTYVPRLPPAAWNIEPFVGHTDHELIYSESSTVHHT